MHRHSRIAIALSTLLALAACASSPPQANTPATDPPAARAVSQAATPTTAILELAATPTTQPTRPAPTLTRLPTPTSAPTKTPPPDLFASKVNIGGYGLHITCRGEGNPTVIFESGGGRDKSHWGLLWTTTVELTRACIYDRAGLGQSDPAPGSAPRTSQAMADELHRLLNNAGIEGPYILVGWSFGGFIARLYARQYPDEVVGLVLEDSSHEQQAKRLAALESLLPPPGPGQCELLDRVRNIPQQPGEGIDNPERLDLSLSAAQVAASGDLGALPLVVVTAGRDELRHATCLPREYREARAAIWQELQKDLLRLSSNSMQIIAARSDHYIHGVEPDVVFEAIRRVYRAAREGTHVDAP